MEYDIVTRLQIYDTKDYCRAAESDNHTVYNLAMAAVVASSGPNPRLPGRQ
jgi:hypothetical protein